MKIPTVRRFHGFTLVELLVVIAIIAVLAGVGLPAGLAAIQKGKKTACLAQCTAMESAVNAFATEYGGLPTDSTADEEVVTDQATGVTLMTILMGLETTTTPKNPRAIRFLQVKEGKRKGNSGVNGMVYSTDGKSLQGLYDPWGGGLHVMLDGDYDERLTVSPSGKSTTLNTRRVAVWSLGADGTKGSGGKSADDVLSW